MTHASFRRRLCGRYLSGCSRAGKRGEPRRASPRLEVLEDRTVPTLLTWTGLGNGGWSSPANWSPAVKPQNGDAVQFTATYQRSSIDDLSVSLASLTIDGGWVGTLNILNNVNLTLTGTGSTWAQNNTYTLSDGITGQGRLTLNPGAVLTLSGPTVKQFNNNGTVTLSNHGTIRQNDAGGFFNGDISNDPAVGSINNETDGTYDFHSDASVLGPFNNFGTVVKTAGSGAAQANRFTNNGGTVDVESGALTLYANWASVSTGALFKVAQNATLNLAGNTVYSGTYTGVGTGSGVGTVTVTGTRIVDDAANKRVLIEKAVKRKEEKAAAAANGADPQVGMVNLAVNKRFRIEMKVTKAHAAFLIDHRSRPWEESSTPRFSACSTDSTKLNAPGFWMTMAYPSPET
jgi:hypothetical protein